MTRRPTAVLALLSLGSALAVSLAACSGDDASPAGTASSPAGPTGTVTVFAAASLKESFGQIKTAFEQSHPGTTITYSFGASSALQAQIEQGAPADVFASASAKNMDAVVAAGKVVGDPAAFAKNVLEIAVPPANPASITGLADLAKPGVKVAVCQAAVPCGKVAATVFANAKITVKPATEEADVKATLAKVQLGEVDAGLVYVTDVRAAGEKVKGIEIPAELNASTTYPIGVLADAKNPELAKEFLAYVLGADGQAALAAAGFAKP